MPPKDKCIECGKPCVGRFCRRCIGVILSQPRPLELPSWVKQSEYVYPPIKRKKGK